MQLRHPIASGCWSYGTNFDAYGERVHVDEGSRGAAQLWNRGHILCFRVIGYGEGRFTQSWTERADDTIRRYKRVVTFHDWSGMTGYDPQSKQRLVEWTRAIGDANPAAYLLFRSKIISMAVAVAGLALRNLNGFSAREPFLAAFEKETVDGSAVNAD